MARDFAFGREHHQATRVSILARGRIVSVLESDFVSQSLDGGLFAGQKAPSFCRASAAVAFQIIALLGGSQRRCLARIDADVHDRELVTDAPFEVLKTLDHAVEHQSAEHRTLVITEDQDDWFFPKIISQMNRRAGLVAEGSVESNLRVELLLEADFGES